MKFTSLYLLALIVVASACSKHNTEKEQTLQELYETYENGYISECTLNGETVFSVGINAYDASSYIFNESGTQIGACNYAWGTVDAICGDLENCEIVYCVEDNIWGYEAVDKYGLE